MNNSHAMPVYLVLLLLIGALSTSCNSASSPGSGNGDVVANLLFVSSARYVPNTADLSYSSYASASFRESLGIHASMAVRVNDIPLTEEGPLSFFVGNPEIPGSPYDLKWVVTGLQGDTSAVTQTMAFPLEFTEFASGDTVLRSKGKVLTYSGSMSDHDLFAFVYSFPYGGEPQAVVVQKDDGKLALTQDILASLPEGRYSLQTIHFETQNVPFQGKFIILESSYDVAVEFVLVP